MQPTLRHRQTRDQRGAILVMVVLVMLMLAGLSAAFLQEGLAENRSVTQRSAMLTAMEVCEMGVAKATLEILALKDAGTDGIGVVSGSFAGGSYDVTATQDADNPDRWVLRARGEHSMAVRRIEVGLRRRAGGDFVEGLFAKDTLTFSGNTGTDAWDSRLGDYASQAVNSDGGGTYASTGGHIGSNMGIVLNGAAVTIRGNAIPGPLYDVRMSGNPTVLGDILPRRIPIDLPPASQAEFEAAFATNNNAELLAPGGGGPGGNGNANGGGKPADAGGGKPVDKGGGKPADTGDYDPTDYSLTSGSNATVTLSGGTYFFSSIKLGAHSTLVLEGPTEIYVTGELDITSGSVVNPSGKPADLRIYAHPYAVGGLPAPASTQIKIRGGSGIVMALYAPDADLDAGGGDDIYGSFVAKTITIHGNTRFHYDKALGDMAGHSTVTIERLYWRDLDERVR